MFSFKNTIKIPNLHWNRRYIDSIGNEHFNLALQNKNFKNTRSLSPKNVLGSKRFIKLRTQLANNSVMLNRINEHIFKEFK